MRTKSALLFVLLATLSVNALNAQDIGGATTAPAGANSVRNNNADDDGFDMGLLGLAGLAGLAGLMPRNRHDRNDVNRSTTR